MNHQKISHNGTLSVVPGATDLECGSPNLVEVRSKRWKYQILLTVLSIVIVGAIAATVIYFALTVKKSTGYLAPPVSPPILVPMNVSSDLPTLYTRPAFQAMIKVNLVSTGTVASPVFVLDTVYLTSSSAVFLSQSPSTEVNLKLLHRNTSSINPFVNSTTSTSQATVTPFYDSNFTMHFILPFDLSP